MLKNANDLESKMMHKDGSFNDVLINTKVMRDSTDSQEHLNDQASR
jgi:hypothetical protein